MSLEFKSIVVGVLDVNCHLLWDSVSRETVIIDPGGDADRIDAVVDELRLRPGGILLTHAHVDHIGGVPEVSRRYDIPVYIHPDDRDLYLSPNNAFPPWICATEGLPEPVSFASVRSLGCRLFSTPGHTPGSVCYWFEDDEVLVSGDTLFRRSVGRTDLPGGDMAALTQSIRGTLFMLPETAAVLAGHGPATTIGEERQQNPFVRP